jgi:hypothetical protein
LFLCEVPNVASAWQPGSPRANSGGLSERATNGVSRRGTGSLLVVERSKASRTMRVLLASVTRSMRIRGEMRVFHILYA